MISPALPRSALTSEPVDLLPTLRMTRPNDTSGYDAAAGPSSSSRAVESASELCSDAFDGNERSDRCSFAYGARLAIRARVVPCPRSLQVGELEDDSAIRHTIAFEDLRGATPNEVSPAGGLDRGCRESR